MASAYNKNNIGVSPGASVRSSASPGPGLLPEAHQSRTNISGPYTNISGASPVPPSPTSSSTAFNVNIKSTHSASTPFANHSSPAAAPAMSPHPHSSSAGRQSSQHPLHSPSAGSSAKGIIGSTHQYASPQTSASPRTLASAGANLAHCMSSPNIRLATGGGPSPSPVSAVEPRASSAAPLPSPHSHLGDFRVTAPSVSFPSHPSPPSQSPMVHSSSPPPPPSPLPLPTLSFTDILPPRGSPMRSKSRSGSPRSRWAGSPLQREDAYRRGLLTPGAISEPPERVDPEASLRWNVVPLAELGSGGSRQSGDRSFRAEPSPRLEFNSTGLRRNIAEPNMTHGTAGSAAFSSHRSASPPSQSAVSSPPKVDFLDRLAVLSPQHSSPSYSPATRQQSLTPGERSAKVCQADSKLQLGIVSILSLGALHSPFLSISCGVMLLFIA